MRTLLPYEDFTKSAEVLDDQRLSRQRAEVMQILRGLEKPPTDKDHAAVKMWRGNERFLCRYGVAVCIEYGSRGHADQTVERVMEMSRKFEPESDTRPEWLGDEAFHASHRAILLRSEPSRYREFWPEDSDDLETVWPRSPKRDRASGQTDEEKLLKRATKLKERLDKLTIEYEEVCKSANLDPATCQPLEGGDVVEIAEPDEEMLRL